MRFEVVEDNVKLAIGKGGNELFMKPRNRCGRRPLGMRPSLSGATSRAANKVVVPWRL